MFFCLNKTRGTLQSVVVDVKKRDGEHHYVLKKLEDFEVSSNVIPFKANKIKDLSKKEAKKTLYLLREG